MALRFSPDNLEEADIKVLRDGKSLCRTVAAQCRLCESFVIFLHALFNFPDIRLVTVSGGRNSLLFFELTRLAGSVFLSRLAFRRLFICYPCAKIMDCLVRLLPTGTFMPVRCFVMFLLLSKIVRMHSYCYRSNISRFIRGNNGLLSGFCL